MNEADVRTLIENQVQEGKCIDYKRDLPGMSDSARKEFLFDVASFANASGGHLVYGIEEEGGVPKRISGLAVADQDAELRRLQSTILDGIDPRIPGLEARFVSIADSNPVLIIHVPKSWNPPHMVTLQGVNKFYTRDSAGKHPLDVGELRGLFAMAGSLTQQIRKFRADRVSRIIADETPIGLVAGPKLILHLLPLQAFSSTSRISLSAAERLSVLMPFAAAGYNRRINLDGLLHYTTTGFLGQSGFDAYLQLFHNGIIETVDAALLSANSRETINAPRLIPGTFFDQKLILHVQQYLAGLQSLGISPPIVGALALTGVKGFHMAGPAKLRFSGAGASIDRDIVNIPEIIFEQFKCGPSDLKPMIDAAWNAAGWPSSPNLDP